MQGVAFDVRAQLRGAPEGLGGDEVPGRFGRGLDQHAGHRAGLDDPAGVHDADPVAPAADDARGVGDQDQRRDCQRANDTR